MSKELVKNLIDLVPDKDIDLLYHVIVKFIPEVEPELGEIELILAGREDRKNNGFVSHDEINWN